MSLLMNLMRRGDVPSANEMERVKSGGDIPPLRGYLPWESGFEGYERQLLQELARSAEMRDKAAQMGLERLLPMLMVRKG